MFGNHARHAHIKKMSCSKQKLYTKNWWVGIKGEHRCKLIFYRGVSGSKSSNFTTKLLQFFFISMTPFKPSHFENKIFCVLFAHTCACMWTQFALTSACMWTHFTLTCACTGLTLLLLVHACGLRLIFLVATGTQSLSLANSLVAFRLQHEFWFFL
jgi:hypothetical protein